MEFLEAPAFTRHVSRYLTDDEYRELQNRITAAPLLGEQQIWLMTLYDKDEASDLTPKEKQGLKSAIETELRARQGAKLAKQRKPRR